MVVTNVTISSKFHLHDTAKAERKKKSPYQDAVHHIIAGLGGTMIGIGAIAWSILGTMPGGLAMVTSFVAVPLVGVGLIMVLIGLIKCGVVHSKLRKQKIPDRK